MGMNISIGNRVRDNYQYKTINTNSAQYKAAARDNLSAIIEAEMMMSPEQKMMYELLGGREANMKAHMQWYASQRLYSEVDAFDRTRTRIYGSFHCERICTGIII